MCLAGVLGWRDAARLLCVGMLNEIEREQIDDKCESWRDEVKARVK